MWTGWRSGGVHLLQELCRRHSVIYPPEYVADANLVRSVTSTRPGWKLSSMVACELDQWNRAFAGQVNVAPRHLTAEFETLLSAKFAHEGYEASRFGIFYCRKTYGVVHVHILLELFKTFTGDHILGFDPQAFTHFR